MTAKERLKAAVQITTIMRSASDAAPDVQLACQIVCRKHGYAGIGELASGNPEAFDDLWETVQAMLEIGPYG